MSPSQARAQNCALSLKSAWGVPQELGLPLDFSSEDPIQAGDVADYTTEALRGVTWLSLNHSPVGVRTQTQNKRAASQVTTTYKMGELKSCISVQVTFK